MRGVVSSLCDFQARQSPPLPPFPFPFTRCALTCLDTALPSPPLIQAHQPLPQEERRDAADAGRVIADGRGNSDSLSAFFSADAEDTKVRRGPL